MPGTRSQPSVGTRSLAQQRLRELTILYLLITAMMPHGVSWLTPGMQVASLDHAMWFHRSFRMDDWLLYDVESPSSSGARGLVLGKFYARATSKKVLTN